MRRVLPKPPLLLCPLPLPSAPQPPLPPPRSYTWVDQAALEGCNATRIRARQVVGGDVLPEQADHKSRGLGLGPDGRLYVTVAAPFK